MKNRVHTSRKERDLLLDGLRKHHQEGVTLKVEAHAAQVKTATQAAEAKRIPTNRARGGMGGMGGKG